MIESITVKLGLDLRSNPDLPAAIDARVSQMMNTADKTEQFQRLSQPELNYLKTLPLGVLAKKAIRLVELQKGVTVLTDEAKAEFAELHRFLDQAFAQNAIPDQRLADLEAETAELKRRFKVVQAKAEKTLLNDILRLNSSIATIFKRCVGTVYSYTINPIVKLVIYAFQKMYPRS